MARLRIGIDGYNLAMPHGTGIATYGLVLARALKASGYGVDGLFGVETGRDPALAEVVFFDSLGRDMPGPRNRRQARIQRWRRRAQLAHTMWPAPARDVPLTDRVEKGAYAERFAPFDRLTSVSGLFDMAHRSFAATGRFLRVKMDRPPDIMHWTYPVPVELAGARNIYTLHDLVPLKLPYTTLDNKRAYRRIVSQCVARGAHICTVSEASRADIVAELGADPARVTNTWQASPPVPGLLSADPGEDAAAIEGVFGLPHRGYFLFFGAIEPKKNVGRLIEAHLATRSETPLVIVGGKGWSNEGELSLLPGADEDPDDAHVQSVGRRVVRLDYLSRALLLKLIRGARAVLFPSLYEGFGLPVLEAMQLGTPVLTSHTSSLPEVAGDAAVLVNPYDVADIMAGLRTLDADPALRERLSAAGLAQAERFSEARYRARLDAMYATVMGATPPGRR